MLCAGDVRIAGVPQQFWAVWDREARDLRERTRLGRRHVTVADDRVTIDDAGRGVSAELALERYGDFVEVCSPHGRSYIWTRKWLARASGQVRIDGRSIDVEGPLLIDESAGYHARVTDWKWSAGFGVTADGDEVAWNLVTGIHDSPTGSERTVWLNGAAEEIAALEFAEDLSSVGSLTFHAEAVRARNDSFGLMRSDYEQPFGTFSGALPGLPQLSAGYGVMERHEARW